MANLTSGNIDAIETKYHTTITNALWNYNRARAADSTGADRDPDAQLHSIAFAELVANIENFCTDKDVVFSLPASGSSRDVQDLSGTDEC